MLGRLTDGRGNKLACLVLIIGSLIAPNAAHASPEAVRKLADEYVVARVAQDPGLADRFDLPTKESDRRRLLDRSPAALVTLRNAEDRIASELATIDRSRLTGEPRILHALLTEELTARIGLRICRQELWDVSNFEGWPELLARQAASARVETPTLRSSALVRWRGIPSVVDREIANLRVGLELGYSVPKPVVRLVIEQIRRMAAETPEASPFFDVARNTDDASFRREMAWVVSEKINPSLNRYRTFLESEYLPRARDGGGVGQLPDGKACYAALARAWATLPLSPDELLERAEAARSEARATAIDLAITHFGTSNLGEALMRIDGDPKHRFASSEEMLSFGEERMLQLTEAVKPLFKAMPVQAVVVQGYPPHITGIGAANYQRSPSLDRPGTVRLPLDRARTFPRYLLARTIAHEAVPGHHLGQSTLVGLDVHPLRRLVLPPAYDEGWARYAEKLPSEVGIPAPPELLIGEAVRAGARNFVVDLGVNAFGWGAEEVFQFEKADGATRESALRSLIRPMAFPGSHIPYIIGEQEISALRREAEIALGGRFNVRDFHEVILRDGPVPLWFMRENVEAWIAEAVQDAPPRPR